VTPSDRERAIEDIARKEASGLYSASQIAVLKDAYLGGAPSPVMGNVDPYGNHVGVLGADPGKSSAELKQDLARYSPSMEPADSVRLTLGREGVYDHDAPYQASKHLDEVAADLAGTEARTAKWMADLANPLKEQGREYLDRSMLPPSGPDPRFRIRPPRY
jgi:hypothetical protein